jgi:flagellar hook-associated protein 3 FlgL
MQISTNQFLLGSLGSLLTQQSNVNQLDREIATGQTMLDATSDPAGAGKAVALTSSIDRLSYDSGNATAATEQLQNGLGALQQVSTLIDQLRQIALEAADGGTSAASRSALVSTAQSGLQQLVQLANSQAPDGSYIFAGTNVNAAPFETLANGQVVFTGNDGSNRVEVAPSVNVPLTVSGRSIFSDIPAGENGVGVTAAAGNTGTDYAVAQNVTSVSQLTAEQLAGTQYEIAFSASGSSLNYTVTSGTGSPGSVRFLASSGTVVSGSFTNGQELQFGGLQVKIVGTPQAGDQFTVQPAATSSLFQTVQGLITALQSDPSHPQNIENTIANLDGAQNNILSAQASLGANLVELQGLQTQNSTTSSNDQAQLSNLQSANLPQVMANYSEGVTALQAAELAFGKIQNMSLFSVIQ